MVGKKQDKRVIVCHRNFLFFHHFDINVFSTFFPTNTLEHTFSRASAQLY